MCVCVCEGGIMIDCVCMCVRGRIIVDCVCVCVREGGKLKLIVYVRGKID